MSAQLKKQLTLYGLIMISIGSCIGAGIFFTPSLIAGYLSEPSMILTVWAVGSLCVLCGALTFSEMSAMYPGAGGMYVYIREAYGDMMAFLFGWATLTVINTSSIAILSLVFAEYLAYMFPMGEDARLMLATAAILVVTAINVFRVKLAEWVAGTFTTLKILGILAIVGVALFMAEGVAPDFTFTTENHSMEDPDLSLLAAFGLAFTGVWFSVGGWQHSSFLAGEAKDAVRYIPRAMIIGTIVVGVIYFLINLAYMHLLPIEQIAGSDELAAEAVHMVLPNGGGTMVAIIIAISTLGTVAIYTLSAPRIYHAMAQEGIFFKVFAKVHPKFLTPMNAILFQAAWAIVFLFAFRETRLLVEGLVFADVTFYMLVALAVIIFRITRPDIHRPYRTFGYPVVPVIFILISSFLAINTLIEKPESSMVGIGCLAVGVPLYFYFKRTKV